MERSDISDKELRSLERRRNLRTSSTKVVNGAKKPFVYVGDKTSQLFNRNKDFSSGFKAGRSDRSSTSGAKILGVILAVLVVVAVVVAALNVGSMINRLGDEKAQAKINEMSTSFNSQLDAIKQGQLDQQKKLDDVAAENARLKTELEAAKKQPATPVNNGTTTVGSADGASLPANPQLETNREIFRKLSGQAEGVDYSFDLKRDWAATVDPGLGQFGQSVYNEQELASFLGSGTAQSEAAIQGLQNKMLAVNGLSVSRQNALNANNYICVQYLKPNRSNNMAYILNGSVEWDRGFVDQPGAISCAYVGPEMQGAVAAGKKVVLYGFDAGCINPQEVAITVNEKPTLERITPHVGTTVTPPTGTTINYPTPKMIEVCVLASKTRDFIKEAEYNPKLHSYNYTDCEDVPEECVQPASPGEGYTWNEADCVWTPPTIEECVQPTSPGPGYTWDEENCKWCPPVEECVQPESPGEGYTWNEEDCVWTPPTVEECIQPESPGEGYTWNEEDCEWTPPTIEECVQPESPGEGWTWDEENCKWCPPVEECVQPESPGEGYTWNEEDCEWTPPTVEECKPGVPVGSPLCDKDPSEDPEQTGNAPDNGTPMPDPGPATDPAVPEEDAPATSDPPAPPAPAVETPRPPEEIPVNEGAGPETPVEGTVDETVCEVCGGGIGTEAVQAAVVAPAAASAPAVEDTQAAAQAEADRVAAEQAAAQQAEANRVAAEQAAAQQAAAEQAAAQAQQAAAAQAQAQAVAEQQAVAKAQADAAAKAQANAEAKAAAEAQAKAAADAQKAQQQEVPTQVAKNTHKGDVAKGDKTSVG